MASIARTTSTRNSHPATKDAGHDLTPRQLRAQAEQAELARLHMQNEVLAALGGESDALYSAWHLLVGAGQYVAARMVHTRLQQAQAQFLATLHTGAVA